MPPSCTTGFIRIIIIILTAQFLVSLLNAGVVRNLDIPTTSNKSVFPNRNLEEKGEQQMANISGSAVLNMSYVSNNKLSKYIPSEEIKNSISISKENYSNKIIHSSESAGRVQGNQTLNIIETEPMKITTMTIVTDNKSIVEAPIVYREVIVNKTENEMRKSNVSAVKTQKTIVADIDTTANSIELRSKHENEALTTKFTTEKNTQKNLNLKDNAVQNKTLESNEISAKNSEVLLKRRSKIIKDNSTNTNHLNLPETSDVWTLVNMKTISPLAGESDSRNSEYITNNTIPNVNEKNLLDWSHIMINEERSELMHSSPMECGGVNETLRRHKCDASMRGDVMQMPNKHQNNGTSIAMEYNTTKESLEFSPTTSLNQTKLRLAAITATEKATLEHNEEVSNASMGSVSIRKYQRIVTTSLPITKPINSYQNKVLNTDEGNLIVEVTTSESTLVDSLSGTEKPNTTTFIPKYDLDLTTIEITTTAEMPTERITSDLSITTDPTYKTLTTEQMHLEENIDGTSTTVTALFNQTFTIEAPQDMKSNHTEVDFEKTTTPIYSTFPTTSITRNKLDIFNTTEASTDSTTMTVSIDVSLIPEKYDTNRNDELRTTQQISNEKSIFDLMPTTKTYFKQSGNRNITTTEVYPVSTVVGSFIQTTDYGTTESSTEKATSYDYSTLVSLMPKSNEIYTSISSTILPSTFESTRSIDQPYFHEETADINIIIAISVSVIGIIALILLVGFLYVVRRRQKHISYGQRCRPVSLDAYSMENVSVYNSVRRKGAMRASHRSYGNAAFDDPSLSHNILKTFELANFVERRCLIFDEFKHVPQIIAHPDEVPQGCELKNRYANVIPIPETRVLLQQQNNDKKTEYINANYVRGPSDAANHYIACQAPLESTVADFWRMIWEQNSRVIIQATNLIENGIEKCAEYLPPSVTLDNHATYGEFQITLKTREVKEKYAISILILNHLSAKTNRELSHFWYKWPETGVPNEEASVIAMLLESRSALKSYVVEASQSEKEKEKKEVVIGNSNFNNSNKFANDLSNKFRTGDVNEGPVTVHCSPGTGRTGTIIACDIAVRSLEAKRSIDIPQIVYYVRRGRASAVQTKEQYEFIYKVANMYATKISNASNDN